MMAKSISLRVNRSLFPNALTVTTYPGRFAKSKDYSFIWHTFLCDLFKQSIDVKLKVVVILFKVFLFRLERIFQIFLQLFYQKLQRIYLVSVTYRYLLSSQMLAA